MFSPVFFITTSFLLLVNQFVIDDILLSFQGQLGLPFDVLLTTYDIALLDQDFLSQIPWHFSVIDEAQRLKNPSSVCILFSLFLS